jgi:hypothetical protein
MASDIRFLSLGMVVLDELRLPNGNILYDCPGGSGMWSTLGARVVSSPEQAGGIGCFIMAGCEFPKEILDLVRSWGLTLEVNVSETRESTRGILEYYDEAFGRKQYPGNDTYRTILKHLQTRRSGIRPPRFSRSPVICL